MLDMTKDLGYVTTSWHGVKRYTVKSRLEAELRWSFEENGEDAIGVILRDTNEGLLEGIAKRIPAVSNSYSQASA
ncbi:unnamed protein product, partial [Ilex paraguariensis]